MLHNAGGDCKAWVFNKIFWDANIPYGEFIKINVPELDIPNIGEQKAAGTWDFYKSKGSWE